MVRIPTAEVAHPHELPYVQVAQKMVTRSRGLWGGTAPGWGCHLATVHECRIPRERNFITWTQELRERFKKKKAPVVDTCPLYIPSDGIGGAVRQQLRDERLAQSSCRLQTEKKSHQQSARGVMALRSCPHCQDPDHDCPHPNTALICVDVMH